MKIDLRTDVLGDGKKFEFLYNGFIIGGSLTQQKGTAVLRREIVLLGKLESISREADPPKKIMGDEPARELTGGVIELSAPEYEMLTSYIGTVPWNTGQPVRDAVAVLDWLETLR